MNDRDKGPYGVSGVCSLIKPSSSSVGKGGWFKRHECAVSVDVDDDDVESGVGGLTCHPSASPSSPSDVSAYVVYAGRHQLNGFNPQQTAHGISQVVIPPGYVEPHSGMDVALVELSGPVTWSDHVQPVCLPAAATLFPADMRCYVTGWGDTRDDGTPRCSRVGFQWVLL